MRLAHPHPEDREKVFALKVLRKVEGAPLWQTLNRSNIPLLMVVFGSYKTQAGRPCQPRAFRFSRCGRPSIHHDVNCLIFRP